MCDNGKATIIRWEADPAVPPPHNSWPVWCNGNCIQTPQGQESPVITPAYLPPKYEEQQGPRLMPAVDAGPGQHMHGDWLVDHDKCPHQQCPYYKHYEGDPHG